MKTIRCLIYLFLLLIVASVNAQVVKIPDSNLEQALREALDLQADMPITQQEMLRLTELRAPNSQIADLIGLEYASNLKSLSLWGNPISALSPLTNLTQLKYLHLGLCEISDVSPLAGLTGLTNLYLHGNQISNIKPLENLTRITHLWLGWNLIQDISPLSNLTRLT